MLSAGQPQLMMRRSHLLDLPPVLPPAGYAIRCFQPGDEPAWDAIILESFQTEPGKMIFEVSMRSDPAFLPERVFFATSDGEPVGTASAWHRERFGSETGYLHMVGVRTAHLGRRLGYWVSLAALHRLAAEGCRCAVLHTDDFRLPAIKTYLNLDFEPMLVHENQRERWRAVFEALGEAERWHRGFKEILDGPVMEQWE